MKYNDWQNEQLIKEAIAEYTSRMQAPVSQHKEQIWENIQQTLAAQKQLSKPIIFKNRLFLKTVAAAVILLSVLTVFVAQSTSGSALFWIKEMFIQSKDAATQISTTAGFNLPEGAPVFPTEIDESITFYVMEDTRLKTIEEAQEIANFEILQPKYLPEGYEFQYAFTAMGREEDYKSNDMTLLYQEEGTDSELTIRQSYYGLGYTDAYVYDHEDTQVEDILIAGHTGKVFLYKNQSSRLWLELPHMKVTIDSYLEKDEMIKIAESLL